MVVNYVDSNLERKTDMDRWTKNETLSRALASEGCGIAKGIGKELLSIAPLGLCKPRKRWPKVGKRQW